MKDKKMVARELLKMAKMLVGASGDDVFTVKKPIRFKPEGSTMNSIANAKMIKEAGYSFIKGAYTYNKNMADWRLQAFFSRGEEVSIHTFLGFSIGYSGEGPHGMMEFSNIFGIGLKEDSVMGKDTGLPDKGTVDLVQAFG